VLLGQHVFQFEVFTKKMFIFLT